MRLLYRLPPAALSVLTTLLVVPLLAQHAAPPAESADHYPAFVRQANEHVVIAVDPYDTSTKASIFRINYAETTILPLRIIVTNEGDTPISLDNARIDFITAAGDKIRAAEPRDVERALDRAPDPRKAVKVGPFKIGGKGKNRDKSIEEDFSNFEYRAIAVEPHTTRAGFLFYDLADMANPLSGAHLELRRIQTGDSRELFAFEIPFDKYLASKK
jgi:hypothetical protein